MTQETNNKPVHKIRYCNVADRLVKHGEAVLQNRSGAWWGRTRSGQAILLDGTIQRLLEGGCHEN
ncbi:MAG: hypothetical protein AAGA96_08395 [Verrucomicrobiota bacterium]